MCVRVCVCVHVRVWHAYMCVHVCMFVCAHAEWSEDSPDGIDGFVQFEKLLPLH